MKKYIPTLAQIVTFIGLPASFVAAAFHEIVPQTFAANQTATIQPTDFLAPILFVATVMSVALIIIHTLQEEQRLAHFTNLHLRLSPTNGAKTPVSLKAQFATAKAIW